MRSVHFLDRCITCYCSQTPCQGEKKGPHRPVDTSQRHRLREINGCLIRHQVISFTQWKYWPRPHYWLEDIITCPVMVSTNRSSQAEIRMNRVQLMKVQCFKYLGVARSKEGGYVMDICFKIITAKTRLSQICDSKSVSSTSVWQC